MDEFNIHETYQGFFCFNFNYYWLTIRNSVLIKKGFLIEKCSTSKVWSLSTWLGFLYRELLHQCSVARRQSLLRCYRLLWYEPSAHLWFWVGCFSFSSGQYSTEFLWSSGDGKLAGQSSTVITWSPNYLVAVLALWVEAERKLLSP